MCIAERFHDRGYMLRIAHIGAFNFKNLGDLLFADVLGRQLRKRLGEVEIELFSPLGGTLPVLNETIFPITSLEERHQNNSFDAFVVGGGDLIHFQKIIAHVDSYGSGPVIYDVLHMWVIPSLLSWKYNVPLLWNAPGAPLHFEQFQREIARDLCRQATYVSVRDDCAAKELFAVGLDSSELVVVPDSVLSISNLFSQDELDDCFNSSALTLDPGGYVFFQCNMSFTDDELICCAEQLKRLKSVYGLDILLQPIGYGIDDCKALRRLDELSLGAFHLSRLPFNQYEILSLLANCACYIGSSLHGCIIANSFSKPNILINKNRYNKSDGLIELLEHPSSMIHEVSELPTAIDGLFQQELGVSDDVLNRIETHFDTLVDSVITGRKPKMSKRGLDVSLSDYIYRMGELERGGQIVKQELNAKRESLELILAENERLRDRTSQLEAELGRIKESTSWKITCPIRAMKSFFDHKKA